MEILKNNKSVSEYLTKVSNELNEYINGFTNESLIDVLKHFFRISGKMIRPSLLFLSANAVDPEKELNAEIPLIKLGMCLELIHSASLIHDDVIDNDELRRGFPTVSNAFGEKIAILTGDILFTNAYAIVAEYLSAEYVMKLTNLATEMCVAEIIQAKDELTEDDYLNVIKGKTASFMAVSCEIGAIYVGATPQESIAFHDFGMALGMLYQIKDDIADEDKNGVKFYSKKIYDQYLSQANQSLGLMKNSQYKDKLKEILELINQS